MAHASQMLFIGHYAGVVEASADYDAVAAAHETGATGHIEFDEKGDRKDAEMTIFQMKNGKVEPVAIMKAGKTTKIEAGAAAAPAAPATTAAAAPAAAPAKEEPKKDEAKK